ncbi:MAG: hypothetical protein BWY83_03188 [bacterium ADurb.Bin478]|nr:MAG: hypothetical protein BWY83_03188 [bacterium ADurb.Bin478]
MDHAGAPKNPGRGLTTLHFDSWEMGAQNWSADFAAAFEKSRGYPPLRFLPALTGRVVDSVEVTERFLWDLRQAAQELVIENHVGRLRGLAAKRGLAFSSEPYDLNPCSNMEMGAVADVPMCEFWSKGFGFSTEFSCIEAASTAHTTGKAVVAAEAFTAAPGEDWRQHPASMKAQGDWALCAGINRCHSDLGQSAGNQFFFMADSWRKDVRQTNIGFVTGSFRHHHTDHESRQQPRHSAWNCSRACRHDRIRSLHCFI